MSNLPHLLSLVTFLPLVGAGLILLFVRGDDAAAQRNARWAALWTSLITFGLSILLWTGFDAKNGDFQFVESTHWLQPLLNISYHVGIDGISLFFVLLSTLLTPICIVASWQSATTSVSKSWLSARPDRKSTRLNSRHERRSRMPSSA